MRWKTTAPRRLGRHKERCCAGWKSTCASSTRWPDEPRNPLLEFQLPELHWRDPWHVLSTFDWYPATTLPRAACGIKISATSSLPRSEKAGHLGGRGIGGPLDCDVSAEPGKVHGAASGSSAGQPDSTAAASSLTNKNVVANVNAMVASLTNMVHESDDPVQRQQTFS